MPECTNSIQEVRFLVFALEDIPPNFRGFFFNQGTEICVPCRKYQTVQTFSFCCNKSIRPTREKDTRSHSPYRRSVPEHISAQSQYDKHLRCGCQISIWHNSLSFLNFYPLSKFTISTTFQLRVAFFLFGREMTSAELLQPQNPSVKPANHPGRSIPSVFAAPKHSLACLSLSSPWCSMNPSDVSLGTRTLRRMYIESCCAFLIDVLLNCYLTKHI